VFVHSVALLEWGSDAKLTCRFVQGASCALSAAADTMRMTPTPSAWRCPTTLATTRSERTMLDPPPFALHTFPRADRSTFGFRICDCEAKRDVCAEFRHMGWSCCNVSLTSSSLVSSIGSDSFFVDTGVRFLGSQGAG
jgi:hypothetical protein